MIADQFPWLTAIVLLPLVASLLIPVLPDKDGKRVRWYALGVGIADFVLMCYAFWKHYDTSSASFQLVESYAWMPQLGLELGCIGRWVIIPVGAVSWLCDNTVNVFRLASRSQTQVILLSDAGAVCSTDRGICC